MRHAKSRLQLNRFTSWHDATLASLARSLLIYQSIKTTRQKAQAAKPLIEKLISLGKKNTLAARRQAYRILCDHRLVSALFNDVAVRFKTRTGGYTRVINLGSRRGDGATLVILELTEIKKKEQKKPAKEKKALTPQQEEQQHKETITTEPAAGEKKQKVTDLAVKEKPPQTKKPPKKFLSGLKSIFKKERDAL